MASRVTWRWMFWSTSIFQAAMVCFSFTTFHETYAPVILSRRAKRLRQETGDPRYHTIHDRAKGMNYILREFGRALSRPLRLLIFHPIIQLTGVISAFNYGLLYIVLSTFSDIWIKQYDQPIEISGLHYIACAAGEVVGSQLCGPLLDYLHRKKQSRIGHVQPEYRIPFMIPGAVLAPVGLLIYGWCVQYKVHWSVVDLGIFITTFSMQVGGMGLQAYVIDAYLDHTSSAMAATQFLRSLTAFLFPLFAPTMYESMGYGWGNTALAFIGLGLGLPAPLLIWYYGARLRAKAQSSY